MLAKTRVMVDPPSLFNTKARRERDSLLALTLDTSTAVRCEGGSACTPRASHQLQHALQSARGRESGAAPACRAALLDDLGHMVNDQARPRRCAAMMTDTSTSRCRSARALRRRRAQPIRLHVDAKRFCAPKVMERQRRSILAKPLGGLEAQSELQGGIFTEAEAQRFFAQLHADGAVRVRLWDDEAKLARDHASARPLLVLAEAIALRR